MQFASLSFDASFHEIFATWCSGGTLFVLTEAERLDTSNLADYLSLNAIEKVILPVENWLRSAGEALVTC